MDVTHAQGHQESTPTRRHITRAELSPREQGRGLGRGCGVHRYAGASAQDAKGGFRHPGLHPTGNLSARRARVLAVLLCSSVSGYEPGPPVAWRWLHVPLPGLPEHG